jgi:DNA-binding MarR family transcriptional regulator
VTFNISGTRNDHAADDTTVARRDSLATEVLNELLSWNPREFVAAFRHWHRDAVSLIHLNVLTILDVDGPDSMSHLADALEVSVASMTGIVDRMEKRGLVERRHDGADRRVVIVHPTEAGRDVFRAIDRRRKEGLTKLLTLLSEDEMAGLLKGHRALRAARATFATNGMATGEPPDAPSESSATAAAGRRSARRKSGAGRRP